MFPGTLEFTCLMTLKMKKQHVGRPEGFKIDVFWMSFSRVGFGRPPGADFIDFDSILGSLGKPILPLVDIF